MRDCCASVAETALDTGVAVERARIAGLLREACKAAVTENCRKGMNMVAALLAEMEGGGK